MLRRDGNAGFVWERGLLFGRARFVAGRRRAEATLGPRALAALERLSRGEPVPVLEDGRRVWWLFRERVWWEDEGYGADDVAALALDRERRDRRRLERARDLAAVEAAGGPAGPRRPGIPEEVRRAVFRRDGGRCAACGSAELLQLDHVIPVARGGDSGPANLQLLCAPCNRDKGDAI